MATTFDEAVTALAWAIQVDSTCVRVGGEANALKTIRRHLLNDRGMAKASIHVSEHWKHHIAGWDHHEPIDDEA